MGRFSEFWLALFFTGMLLINFPFVSIFDKPVFIFGIPLLYVYLIVGWLCSIIVIYIFTKRLKDDD